MRVVVDNDQFFEMQVDEGATVQLARGGSATLVLVDRGYGLVNAARTISFYLTRHERRELIKQLLKADEYTLVECGEGDWCGLYREGLLLREGHIGDIENALPNLLDIPLKVVYPDDRWMEERGRLPKNLDEVVLKEG